ncbi:Uncharacterized protein DAT39_021195 [Clarias magur]|uniref:Uncharacterized protein n=1 Tax=Clarias magur TaxID=1594786 RepID=A0A8J4T528_CLAMG|nr:Uncharacterized protein DAT39_021195 [Clarias magur]
MVLRKTLLPEHLHMVVTPTPSPVSCRVRKQVHEAVHVHKRVRSIPPGLQTDQRAPGALTAPAAACNFSNVYSDAF